MVNEGFQVFNKTTGASVLGPVGIQTVWTGFGGPCETSGSGDPVVLYDQLANRWLISQFAGVGVPTDECVAVSTTSDATGSWHRYGFHLGSNFFDYPHLGVWPDAYYMSMNVFNSTRHGSSWVRNPSPLIAPRCSPANRPLSSPPESPADRSKKPICPPISTAQSCHRSERRHRSWSFRAAAAFSVFHFHVDFVTPLNSTFTLFASPAFRGLHLPQRRNSPTGNHFTVGSVERPPNVSPGYALLY